MYKQIQRYQEIMVSTASPIENIVLLYKKCLQHVQQALVCLQNKKYAAKGEVLLKAIDIINALDSGLDMEQGEVADHLHNSYQALLVHLSQANLKNDERLLELSIGWLRELLDAWLLVRQNVNEN